jgi:hypothetical protein
LPGQVSLGAKSVADRPGDENGNKDASGAAVAGMAVGGAGGMAAGGPGGVAAGGAGGVAAGRAAVLVLPRSAMTLTDQVTKAEIIWALKAVDSNYSYSSCDDFVPIMQRLDPSSVVFQKMSLGRNKTSYIISHGLYPYFMKNIIKSIQDAPAFTLGTDAGTFKLHGLAKLVDIVIRWVNCEGIS